MEAYRPRLRRTALRLVKNENDAERATAEECQALLLRAGFGYSYADLARALRKSQEACRQLVHRGRSAALAGRPKRRSRELPASAATAFLRALRQCNSTAALAILTHLTCEPQKGRARRIFERAGMADYPIAKTADIAPGRTLRVVVDGTEVLLCNVEGTLYAIEDVCTHDGAPLDQGELEECRIVCPRHGAEFDVRTGEVLKLPAVMPLPTYSVRVEGDDVFVDV